MIQTNAQVFTTGTASFIGQGTATVTDLLLSPMLLQNPASMVCGHLG